MAADHEALRIVRRAILEHIRELVEDLSHWADQLERLDSTEDISDLLDSAGHAAMPGDFAGMAQKRRPLLSDFLSPEGPRLLD